MKSIIVYPDSNKLSILNPTKQYDYYYDENNRLIKIIRDNTEFSIKYSGNTSNIQSQSLAITDSIYEKKYLTSFSYTNELSIENNKRFTINRITFDTINKKKSATVINKRDSLHTYIEHITQSGKSRNYKSGIRVNTTFHKNFVEYDSIIPQPNGKKHQYHCKRYPDEQYITIHTDSTYISTIKSGQLVYTRTEKEDFIYNEYFYESDSVLSKSISYTYFPNTNNNLILWEKSIQEKNKKRLRKEYPNKKYYRLKDSVLIPKIEFQDSYKCGGLVYLKRQLWSLYHYDLLSSSILTTESFITSVLRHLPIENDNDFYKEDEGVYYNHLKLQLQEVANHEFSYQTGKEHIDKSLLSTIKRPVSYYKRDYILSEKSDEFKIEIITNDDKTFVFYPFEEMSNGILLFFDIIIYNQYYPK